MTVFIFYNGNLYISKMTSLYTVLSKLINPGSPNGPSMVDRWVVRVTFGWPVYDVVRNDNKTAISLCVSYFQPVPKRREIDI